MRLLLISLVLAISGCATKPPIPDAVLPPPEKVVRLDPGTMESCKKLDPLPDTATWEDVLNNIIDNYEKYAGCSKLQEDSIKLLKKFSNYKEP